jgi:hypothetical protein
MVWTEVQAELDRNPSDPNPLDADCGERRCTRIGVIQRRSYATRPGQRDPSNRTDGRRILGLLRRGYEHHAGQLRGVAVGSRKLAEADRSLSGKSRSRSIGTGGCNDAKTASCVPPWPWRWRRCSSWPSLLEGQRRLFCRRASARSKAQTPPLRFSKQFRKGRSKKIAFVQRSTHLNCTPGSSSRKVSSAKSSSKEISVTSAT